MSTSDEASHDNYEAPTISADQNALIETILAHKQPSTLGFDLANDEVDGTYSAVLDSREIGGIVYRLFDDRIVVQAVSVHAEIRKQGVATELIRRVLDDFRAQGRTTTILCPIVQTFVEKHPEYADLVDAKQPGLMRVGR